VRDAKTPRQTNLFWRVVLPREGQRVLSGKHICESILTASPQLKRQLRLVLLSRHVLLYCVDETQLAILDEICPSCTFGKDRDN
jgi:hypothetical protein